MNAKFLTNLAIVVAISSIGFEASAQTDLAAATKSSKLQILSESLNQRDVVDRRRAQERADRLGIPLRRELSNGRVLELQRIAPGIGPIFYITNNIIAADTVSTDELYPGGSASLNLDGSGMTVLEWDGGAIADHPDFDERLTQVDGATIVSGHSTHVAGTLVGSGSSIIDSRGMAYAAHLNAYDWNFDTAEMALAASSGALISNHSYGIAAGWIYLGGSPPDNWWWIGGAAPSDIEDSNFGYYDTETQLWDQVAFDAPFYLIVKAAGNDRSEIGPSPGEEYTVIDQDGQFLSTSTLPRNGDCAPAGYDCLPSASVAKNVLTVGAVDDLVGGYTLFTGPSAVQMADFSGWGPTDDGRIKPDLVGNGMFLYSAWPGDTFAFAAGTSMSAPNVTGSLLLLQQHYQNLNGLGDFMRAATLKALAIHTANETGDSDGPDYEFGWGLLNTKSAAKIITANGGGNHQIIEDSLVDSAVDTVEIVVTQTNVKVSVTLVWSDPPGPVVAPTLDPSDLMLVNDLDLRIISGPSATSYMPWVLNPAVPAAAATTGDNFRDNVEQVVIDGAGSGTYFVKVSHKGTLLDTNNQDYSLIISQVPIPPSTSFFLIDEDFSGGLPAGWSVDTVRGNSWTINTPVPADPRLDNLTGGSGKFAIVDNNWDTNTITSLRPPALNLSTASTVILRFRSNMSFELLETINVDVSTDGGSGWTNVWQKFGLLASPNQYVLDLSGVAAGQNNFMFRFRFDSGYDGYGNYWQIDDIEFEVFGAPASNPPGQASNPDPVGGEVDVSIDANLSWTAGSDTTSHDVYFNGVSQGNQPGTGFDPGTLAYSTPYTWQIDEVNDEGTTTGSGWNFTTEAAPVLPGQASNPGPTDAATNVNIDAALSWTAGSDTTSHDVYFNGVFKGNQPGTGFDPGTLAYSTPYTWRIDEVNAAGASSGTEWSLTTESAPTLPKFHINDINVVTVAANGKRNRGEATVTVYNEIGAVVGAVLSGTFSGDWNGIRGGTTDTNGQIVVETPPVRNGATWQYCVDTASKTSWEFDQVASAAWLCNSPAVPGLASSPNPGNGQSDVAINVSLGWTAGNNTDTHEVYFGNSSNPSFVDSQSGTGFNPGTMLNNTTYYWRIDEVNTLGTTQGVIWSFTTVGLPQAPGQASNPSPAHDANDVDVNTGLSWTAGTQAVSHNVYFGTNATPEPGDSVASKSSTTYNPDVLAETTTYYWRIDEVNTQGTTVGPIWSFTTNSGVQVDSVNITRAEYINRKSELRVEAINSGAPGAVMTVEDFGPMIYNSNKNIYSFSVKPVSKPGTVTVTSSQDGSDTATVTER